MRRFLPPTMVLVLIALCVPPSAAQENGVRGLGPRFGLGTSPDQLIVGMHFDLGRVAPRVRFQPDFEIGLGDDHTIVAGTFPVHYLFRSSGDIDPYLGGGFAIGLEDRDDDDRRGRGDDSDVEGALVIAGGLEWRTGRSQVFFLELNIVAGDLHDFEFVGGLTFR